MAKTIPPKSVRWRGFLGMALALILAQGCGEGETRDFLEPNVLVRLSVVPRSTRLMLGDSVALSAWGHFRNGDSAVVSAIWSAEAGAISAAGWYRAVREGADMVRAAYADATVTLRHGHPRGGQST